MKIYTKAERDENKFILNIEMKPADENQKKAMESFLKDIKTECLSAYYVNKNNEINIGDNFTK